VTHGGNNFNDFPDNQLIKFRVAYLFGRSLIFFTLEFLWSMALRSPKYWRPCQTVDNQKNGRVRLSVRWSM